MRETRHDILFEPVAIGPVTAPNRFYQVPHCSGMGYSHPRTLAAMRAMKAEGGWGVVCTEYCSIHPTSDDTPYPYAAIWDDGDIANLAAMTDGVHAQGSLAGAELWYGGSYVASLNSRMPPLAPTSMPSRTDPVQSAAMDRADIRDLRTWHKDAAIRAKQAGFDVVYVYPAHGYLLSEMMSRSLNQRSDEYGGSLENRIRLVRELLEDAHDAVGDTCAIAVRFSADGHGQMHLGADEAREAIEMLGPLADLWDVTIADYSREMGSSRFVEQGSLADNIAFVRELTGKPVVTVGRYTSPDAMASLIAKGISDFIGAARPSIADPFLPAKIAEGRSDDIRECIGCNICYSGNSRGAPIRCTQNPTMGEEFRRNWHPETVPAGSDETVLIVGAGPAGLEAAHILAKRGFKVALAEARDEAGGRVTLESRLPGLSEWSRVRDYRLTQINRMANVDQYFASHLSSEDVTGFGADHVIIATGARWRSDGRGLWHNSPVEGFDGGSVFTPDDILAGRLPDADKVVVFDDDGYYMGPVIALHLAAQNHKVTYVTPEGRAGTWSEYTEEQFRTQAAMIEAGIAIVANKAVTAFTGARVSLGCIYTDRADTLPAGALVTVTSREPVSQLYDDLAADGSHGFQTLMRIGDCRAPGIIAAAVYAGHKAARELGQDPEPALRDRVVIAT